MGRKIEERKEAIEELRKKAENLEEEKASEKGEKNYGKLRGESQFHIIIIIETEIKIKRNLLLNM